MHVLLDSITDVKPGDTGKVGISGSHGGFYAAAYASRAGLRAVALNDAGRGLDDSGMAGVAALDRVHMAGVTVSADSAEIGSAAETYEHGVISFANRHAQMLGISEGQLLKDSIHLLLSATKPTDVMQKVEETRLEKQINHNLVLCVDSAALIQPEDAGRIIVSGSHGGLIGGNPARACKAEARLVVFNDAGGGKNEIGFSRLPALDERSIAALTVDCNTCQIGNATSALDDGIVSRVNQTARNLGLQTGKVLHEQIAALGSDL